MDFEQAADRLLRRPDAADFSAACSLRARVFSHHVDGPVWFRDTVGLRATCFTEARIDDVDFPADVD